VKHTLYVKAVDTWDGPYLALLCECNRLSIAEVPDEVDLAELNRLAQDHVQCGARSGGEPDVRCELESGHERYVRPWSPMDLRTAQDPTGWDHAALTRGTYWMEDE
jgi:hypothetical protein